MASKGRKNSPQIDLRFQSKLKKILRILSENDIFFENLILFGSFARGDAREDSDIDLCPLGALWATADLQLLRHLVIGYLSVK